MRINFLLKNKKPVIFDKPLEGILVHLRKDGSGNYYLHLLNTPVRKLTSDGAAVDKYFPKAQFDINAGTGQVFGNPHEDAKFWEPQIEYHQLPQINAAFNLKTAFRKAVLFTFDSAAAKELDITIKDGKTYIAVPAGLFKTYAVIKLMVN